MNPLIIISLLLIAIVLSVTSYNKVKGNEFFSDVPKWLLPSGIYVWGDGLIIAPFWALSLIAWQVVEISTLNAIRYYLFFLLVRSAYEVLYWINHQIVDKDYVPPLFRNISWLTPEQHGILYQLLHTCLIIFTATVLAYSFI